MVRAWLLIPKVWNIIHQFSSSSDNDQNMVILPLGIKYSQSVIIIAWQWAEHGDIPSGMIPVPSVVIFSWQWSEYVKTRKVERMLHQLSSSHDNGQSMVIRLRYELRQLLSSHDNGQSMVISPSGMKHVPSVVTVLWQRSEHGYTTQVWNILWPLVSFHDNCQSMVIPPSNMKHSPSNIIVSWQRSEQGDTPLPGWHMLCQLSSSSDNGQSMVIRFRYEICSVSCHHLMTGVRAKWYLHSYETCSVSCHRLMSTVRALCHLLRYETCSVNFIVSWQRTEHGFWSLRY